MVEIKDMADQVLRKHFFRLHVHVNDDTWDTVTTKGNVTKVKAY